MKGLLIFLIGIAVGVIGYNYYLTTQPTATSPHIRHLGSGDTSSAVEHARDTAIDAKDRIAAKLAEWHLSGEDIRQDLEKTGRVVRTKAHEVGASVSAATANTRIAATIKAKYALEKDLPARRITVDCSDGKVSLTGTVGSPDLVGKAVALALDTDGVTEVNSLLTVDPAVK